MARIFAIDVMTIPDLSPSSFEQTVSNEDLAYISELATSNELHMETGSLEFVTEMTQKEKI